MTLTKGEFCQFNLKSRTSLIKENGLMLMKKKIDKAYEMQLFLIYDFYVEVFFDFRKKKVLKVDPILNQNWLDLYLINN